MSETIEKLEAISLKQSSGIDDIEGIKFMDYKDESQLDSVMRLVGRDLSEPYSGKNSFCYLSNKKMVVCFETITQRFVRFANSFFYHNNS